MTKKVKYKKFWKEHECEYCLHYKGIKKGCSLEEENCILDEEDLADIKKYKNIKYVAADFIGCLQPDSTEMEYRKMMGTRQKLNSVDKLYEIIADYKPRSSDNPRYYVKAETPDQAKKIFSGKTSNLTIYGCKRIKDKESVANILENPERYIIF